MSKAYRRSEREPSLLTDSLLILKSSVIFGLSITPGSSEVNFWGCNQCRSEAAQKARRAGQGTAGEEESPGSYRCLSHLHADSHNRADDASRAGRLTGATANLAALSRPMVNSAPPSTRRTGSYVLPFRLPVRR